MPALFLIESYVLYRRFSSVRHVGIRYRASIIGSALVTLATAFIGITLVLNVLGRLGGI